MASEGEGALPAVGSVIGGKYRIDAEIGRGGMGVVVRATHLHLDQSVAIKLLLRATRPSSAARFEREARMTMRLRSEHTVRVLDAGLHGDVPYLAMELLEGCDLRRLLHERGSLSVEDATGYALQACEALAEAHALGIVHRDIKPANLFLTRRFDGSPLIKVLDFGVAKECDGEADREALTTSSVSLGSPMYMAPEQVRDARRVDARADVWSLGVTLYELLASRGPFEATSVSGLLAAVLSDEPRPLREVCPKVPGELERVVRSCLSRRLERRWPSAAALGAALAPFAAPWARNSAARLAERPGTVSSPPEAPTPELLAATISRTEPVAAIPGEAPSLKRRPAWAFVLLALAAGAALPGALASRASSPPLSSAPAQVSLTSSAPAQVPSPSAPLASPVVPEASRPSPGAGEPVEAPQAGGARAAGSPSPSASAPLVSRAPGRPAAPRARVVDDELGF